jgi:hypothetical protein
MPPCVSQHRSASRSGFHKVQSASLPPDVISHFVPRRASRFCYHLRTAGSSHSVQLKHGSISCCVGVWILMGQQLLQLMLHDQKPGVWQKSTADNSCQRPSKALPRQVASYLMHPTAHAAM